MNLGINTTTPKSQIEIVCKCGNNSEMNTDFQINIVGILQFRCNKCGAITNTDGLLKEEVFYDSPNNKLILSSNGKAGL